MSSISGVSSQSNAFANAQRSQMQEKMFSKVDANGSGGVDQAELQSLFTDIIQKTGQTLNANDAFTTMDSNADGSLSSDELATGMKSVMPPPTSTLEFAQNHGSNTGQDDLFSKVDANSDGSVDETEMTAFTDKMKTETGRNSPTDFSQLDKDSDGKLTPSEFDAGKPSGGPQGAQGGGGIQGGPPPGGGPGGPGGPAPASGTGSTDSTTYDPLDTNEDGQVSELERLAGALKELASSSDSGSSESTHDKLLQLAQQVYEQVAAGLTEKTTNTLDATA